MLGRLRMTLAEAQSAYIDFSQEVFVPKHHGPNPARIYDKFKAEGKFDSKPLKKHFRASIVEKGLDPDELFKDPDPGSCKVFVLLYPHL